MTAILHISTKYYSLICSDKRESSIFGYQDNIIKQIKTNNMGFITGNGQVDFLDSIKLYAEKNTIKNLCDILIFFKEEQKKPKYLAYDLMKTNILFNFVRSSNKETENILIRGINPQLEVCPKNKINYLLSENLNETFFKLILLKYHHMFNFNNFEESTISRNIEGLKLIVKEISKVDNSVSGESIVTYYDNCLNFKVI